jgi:hypothetical protein
VRPFSEVFKDTLAGLAGYRTMRDAIAAADKPDRVARRNNW